MPTSGAKMNKPEVIFFGNGLLSDYTLETIAPAVNIIFHAKNKEDLETVKSIKREHPNALGILASTTKVKDGELAVMPSMCLMTTASASGNMDGRICSGDLNLIFLRIL